MPSGLENSLAAPPRRLRKRLWQCGLGFMLFLVTLVTFSHIAGPGTDLLSTSGPDFLPSYTAGLFVRQGRFDLLMDMKAETAAQLRIRRESGLDLPKHVGPWLNPPFFAWVFVPLAALPYRTALLAWFLFNLALMSGATVLLCRMLPREDGWRTWGLVPLLMLCSFPFIQAMAHQQNTFLSLLILSVTVSLWRSGRGMAAGMVAGFLFFKPQLGVVVAAVLCAAVGWRAMVGVAVTGAALLVVTLRTMPGALTAYTQKLPQVLPWLEAGRPYLWERQITLQGFWRLLWQFHATGPAPLAVRGLWPLSAVVVGGALVGALLRARQQPNAESTDRLIAAAITSMPLLMPYYMDYDLLLLAVPAVLLGAEVSKAREKVDLPCRWILWGWMALFPWLFFNAAVAAETRIHLTVAGLTCVAILQCYRVGRALPAAAWRRRSMPPVQATALPQAA